MLRGTNLEHARVHNLRTVLETIRLHGPLSRAETARRTGLTPQTIGNLVHALLELGLVKETGARRGSRGRASISLEVHGAGAFCIGLDLDRGHLTGILVDIGGSVHHRIHLDITFPSPDRALDLMADAVASLAETVERDRIWGVGVGVPGPLRITGGVVDNVINPDGFPGWENVSVAERLTERLDFAVFLENNATAAAIGERFYGAGRDIGDFFYVFLGVGLGGGIISGGQPLRGWQGNTGEIGFMPVRPARAPGEYVGMHFDLFALYALLARSGVSVSSPSELAAVHAARNPILLAWLDDAAEQLAPMLVAVSYLLDPEAIVFGGSWPSTMIDHLMERLEGLLPPLRYRFMLYAPSLVRAEAGPDAAALGVATLPLNALLSPFPTSPPEGTRAHARHQHPLSPIGSP
jgi:predicted NBD/HSP70 family sugar kinase